ncbi:MAG: undecaprenyldiphospho-muramoylpentapeptide beta-N-acetylglucosaminyltransferase [bacterium]
MKILFAGGGTGGHLFSGVAVAEDYLARPRDGKSPSQNDLLFVGTSYGLENTLIPKLGYRLELIPVQQLKGQGIGQRLKSLAQVPYALFKSFQLLRREKPDLVMGIGGYASGPVTLMARFMGIRTAIIEQNSYPGLTNRILGKFVHRVFIAFENARKFFKPSKTTLAGNPVRKSFFNVSPSPQPSPVEGEGVKRGIPPKKEGVENVFTLLILGGSQGAHSINQAMVDALPSFAGTPLRVMHQTGKNDAGMVREAYEKAGVKAEVFDFIQDVQNFYAQADLVIARAGAGTITELQNLGKPSILIPYPYAADDHQRLNAQEVAEAGAARLLLNRDLNGKRLFEEIDALRKDPKLLHSMGEQARRLAKPLAAHEILKICEEMVLGS